MYRHLLIIFIFILFGSVPARTREGGDGGGVAERLQAHLSFLASDSLRGRETGSAGERRAAEYIVSQLAHYGLQPMGDEGTYLQYMPIHASYPRPTARVFIYDKGGVETLRMFADFVLVKSGAQTLIPSPTAMVFAGYGISAPEFEYNDYQTADVAGKIVVFLSGEPPSEEANYFAGPLPTIYSTVEAKIRTAMSRGAVGSILIRHPQDEAFTPWDSIVSDYFFPDMSLAHSVSGHFSMIVPSTIGAMLFAGSPHSWEDILQLDSQSGIVSFPLIPLLTFQEESVQRDFGAYNILARMVGETDSSQYLLLSAHYDHLGIGRPVAGDSIYNGAVYNALGTAGLLELARLFSQLSPRPRRSILFAFLTGEEKGLLGSRYYVDHPVVPLYQTLANINIDGLAMFAGFRDIIGLGAESSTLDQSMQSTADRLGLEVRSFPSEMLAYSAFAHSDQYAFAEAGIPAVLTTEGLKNDACSEAEMLRRRIEWSEHVYHSPFDDLQQPINFAAAAQHVHFIYEWALDLVQGETIPAWNKGVPFRAARLRSAAQKR